MRLSNYILETRGKPQTEEKAIQLIKKNCKKAIKSYKRGDIIYRGINEYSPYVYYDPTKSKRPRRSANTDNYYTLIIDNAPQWKKYPKRSESLICTTSLGKAGAYGQAYVVLPYDGAKIGMITSSDFWDGFKSTLRHVGLGDLIYSLNEIFELAGIELKDDRYSDMVTAFDEFDEIYLNERYEFISLLEQTTEAIGWAGGYLESRGMLDHLQGLFDPVKNKVRLLTIGDKLGCTRCECWTDSKSMLVSYDIITEVINEITKTPK